MNAAATGVARAAGIVLVIVIAAAVGLAVGTLIQQARDGSPAGAILSQDALDTLDAHRAGEAALSADAFDTVTPLDEYTDYAIRHHKAADDVSDYGLRHPTGAEDWADGAVDNMSVPRAIPDRSQGWTILALPLHVRDAIRANTLSDTFRLTGPSDTDE